jgi:hypothetical protein
LRATRTGTGTGTGRGGLYGSSCVFPNVGGHVSLDARVKGGHRARVGLVQRLGPTGHQAVDHALCGGVVQFGTVPDDAAAEPHAAAPVVFFQQRAVASHAPYH